MTVRKYVALSMLFMLLGGKVYSAMGEEAFNVAQRPHLIAVRTDNGNIINDRVAGVGFNPEWQCIPIDKFTEVFSSGNLTTTMNSILDQYARSHTTLKAVKDVHAEALESQKNRHIASLASTKEVLKDKYSQALEKKTAEMDAAIAEHAEALARKTADMDAAIAEHAKVLAEMDAAKAEHAAVLARKTAEYDAAKAEHAKVLAEISAERDAAGAAHDEVLAEMDAAKAAHAKVLAETSAERDAAGAAHAAVLAEYDAAKAEHAKVLDEISAERDAAGAAHAEALARKTADMDAAIAEHAKLIAETSAERDAEKAEHAAVLEINAQKFSSLEKILYALLDESQKKFNQHIDIITVYPDLQSMEAFLLNRISSGSIEEKITSYSHNTEVLSMVTNIVIMQSELFDNKDVSIIRFLRNTLKNEFLDDGKKMQLKINSYLYPKSAVESMPENAAQSDVTHAPQAGSDTDDDGEVPPGNDSDEDASHGSYTN